MRPSLARGYKALAIVLAGLLALLVLVAAGLWWWAGTQGSLDWTLRYIARSQALSAEGVQGSLRSGLTATRIGWEKDGLKVEAFDAQLAWQPLALARGTAKLDYLRAARLRIEDRRPPKPSVMPLSLAIPLRVEIAQVKVAQIQWIAAANSFEAAQLAGGYSFNAVNHKVRLDSLRWAGGSYSGQATVGAHGSLPVDTNLQGRFETAVPGGQAKLALAFTATLRGPLADMRGQALLEGQAGSAGAGTRATATARVTPWAPQPVPQAQADFQQLDLAPLWSQAPRTQLSGRVQVQPAGTGAWVLNAEVNNAQPGPWDQQRLPLEQLSAAGEWRAGGQAVVRRLEARLGGGRVQASGDWSAADAWTAQGKLTGIDPAAIYSAMARLPVSGSAELNGQGQAVAFEVDLKAEGAKGPAKAKPTELAAALGALELRSASARGRWEQGVLSLPLLDVRTSDASLDASLTLRPQALAGDGRARLVAPGLQARLEGKLAERSGAGTLHASSNNAAQALRWLARLPGMPGKLADFLGGGRGEAHLAWQGGWRDPSLQVSVAAPLLELRGNPPGAGSAAGDTAWRVRDATATLNGRLSDAALQVRGRAEQGQRRANLELAGRGGRRSPSPALWQGQVTALNVAASDPALGTGTWTLALQRAFELRWSSGSFDAGAGQAVLAAPRRNTGEAPAVLAWEPVRWRMGELHTAGRLSGLPLGWIELAGGPQLAGSALSGDMVFDAQWDASLGATPRLRASLARSRGDVTVLAESADGVPARVRAGVREARLSITSEGEAVTALLRWDSERGGTADGRLQTRLARGGAAGWQWPDSARSCRGSVSGRCWRRPAGACAVRSPPTSRSAAPRAIRGSAARSRPTTWPCARWWTASSCKAGGCARISTAAGWCSTNSCCKVPARKAAP
jgi:translocation and assembly module TamB